MKTWAFGILAAPFALVIFVLSFLLFGRESTAIIFRELNKTVARLGTPEGAMDAYLDYLQKR